MLKIISRHCPDTVFPDTGHLFPGNCFFFDIETTGFSKEKNMIYLIGTAHQEGSGTTITQFFAEDGQADEPELLHAFLKFCNDFDCCITFNGISFDVPFVIKRALLYGQKEALSRYRQLDLYREIRTFHPLLPVVNLKQKSIEQFLGIFREDKYNGGELIEIYRHFLKSKEESERQLLLLHNYEDVQGMFPLIQMMEYQQLLRAEYDITDVRLHSYTQYDGSAAYELLLHAVLPHPVPAALSFQNDRLACRSDKHQLRFSVPLFSGCKKLFFKDYKNYYYLPEEDRAIHKSVACFVQSSHRQKAKASNCYQKQEGLFLYCPDTMVNSGKNHVHTVIPEDKINMLLSEFRVFKDSITDKNNFLLWNEKERCPENESKEWLLKLYISTFLICQ